MWDVLANLQTTVAPVNPVTAIVLADCEAAGTEIDGVPVVAGMDDAAEYICRE